MAADSSGERPSPSAGVVGQMRRSPPCSVSSTAKPCFDERCNRGIAAAAARQQCLDDSCTLGIRFVLTQLERALHALQLHAETANAREQTCFELSGRLL